MLHFTLLLCCVMRSQNLRDKITEEAQSQSRASCQFKAKPWNLQKVERVLAVLRANEVMTIQGAESQSGSVKSAIKKNPTLSESLAPKFVKFREDFRLLAAKEAEEEAQKKEGTPEVQKAKLLDFTTQGLNTEKIMRSLFTKDKEYIFIWSVYVDYDNDNDELLRGKFENTAPIFSNFRNKEATVWKTGEWEPEWVLGDATWNPRGLEDLNWEPMSFTDIVHVYLYGSDCRNSFEIAAEQSGFRKFLNRIHTSMQVTEHGHGDLIPE